MKNRVIKKIMAYLLVGAMVITTPMTASATESVLQEAYDLDQSGAEGDSTQTGNKMDTSSGTGTSTNTNTNATNIPEDIKAHLPEILGISLDKTIVELDGVGDTEAIRARAVFDKYDPADEEMAWITATQKEQIETQINWFSEDYNIASFQQGGKQGPNAVVLGRKEGQTRVCAWIEADGLEYTNAPMRPTEGDFVAWATVTVRNQLISINFDDTKETGVNSIPCVASKRQYDLKKYTWLDYGEKDENNKSVTRRADKNDIKTALTYSITDMTAANDSKGKSVKTAATITADGILKITRGTEGGKIDILVVSEDGRSDKGTIVLGKENPVTKMGKLTAQKLDLGFAGESIGDKYATTRKVSVPAYNTKEKPKKDDAKTDNPTTDEFIWSSNKPAIAKIKSVSEDGRTATVEAIDVGTAKITVKASSGKNASFNVTVYATPTTVELPSNLETYTGKPKTVTAILRGDEGQKLPVGTTTLKWEIDKVSSGTRLVKNPFAKISSKKDVATIKPVDFLKGVDKKYPTTGEGFVDITITKVTYKSNQDNKPKPLKDKDGKEIKPSTSITIKQSSLKNVSLEVFKNQQKEGKPVSTNIITSESKKSVTDKKKCYVGQKYFTKAGVKNPADIERGTLESIAWTVSGKGVDYNLDDAAATLSTVFKSNAKTTIKASYITVIDDTKGKIKKTTQTINITPIQNATSIAFAKPVVVKNPGKNPQAVTFSIPTKNIVPKKAVCGDITWKIKLYDAGKEGQDAFTDIKKVDDSTNKSIVKSYKKNSITVLAPVTAGSVIKVGAYSATGAVAYGYVYVTEQTKKVIPGIMEGDKFKPIGTKTSGNKEDCLRLKVGETKTITAQVTVPDGKSTTNKFVDEKAEKFYNIVTDNKPNEYKGDTNAYITEPIVSYTLDKKGAEIVKIDANGKVTPLKEEGTAIVTLKTLSGKSAKAAIVIEK